MLNLAMKERCKMSEICIRKGECNSEPLQECENCSRRENIQFGFIDQKVLARNLSMNVRYNLNELSSSLRHVGLISAAEIINEALLMIEQSTDLYEASWDRLFADAMKAARDATTNLFSAAIAATTITKENKDEPG